MNEQQTSLCNITAALISGRDLLMTYADRDGVFSARLIVPLSIERAKNGNGIVRAFDVQRNAARTFVLHRITDAVALV